MADLLIDYAFKKLNVSNPGGALPMTIANGTVTAGPGPTPAGTFAKAIDLGTSGAASVQISGLPLDLARFAVRIVFNAKGPVTKRQNLVESDILPFALFLMPRAGSPSSEFDLVASVAPKAHGWRAATTRFGTALKAGTWYVADLVYDQDTVGVFIDGAIVSVHAFPQGTITKGAGKKLYLGTWVDGARDHFNGKVAALTLHAGVPDDLESLLDERRTHAEWFITHKVELLRPGLDLGEPTAAISLDSGSGSYLQPHQGGSLMYHDAVGTAFELHGAINARFLGMSNRSRLGYLVSDESDTTKGGGRKSVFTKGAIYWSGATGAVPVFEQIYLDYEGLGESAAIGFPTAPESSITGGLQQTFEGARMFHRSGAPKALEVHGAILAKFVAIGGAGTWGFPVTNESDVKKGSSVIGKYSEFERCTIYWSAGTGAFETHGDIRRKYQDMGGPTGELGFPTSDEADIPGVAGPGRYNSFEKASLLWYGSFASMIVGRPFTIFIGRIDADESEGFLMGENDMYIYVQVKDGTSVVYDKRLPSSGDWGGTNSKDVNLNIPVTLVPNPSRAVTFSVDVWESDPGNDDHLGKWTKTLDATNGWGLLENGGILNSGSFSDINSITASVKPVVDLTSMTEAQKWWGVTNQGTDDLTYGQYASAFSDVDSDAEWWDATDWLDKAFYELVVEDIAENGNCFGMSLESIYARKNSSLFSLPLDRFTSWGTVRPEVNIKHQYQVGAGPIWWFVKEFVTGNTHDPVDVFTRTRDEFRKGNNPVLCIAQNYDFSGAPHCIAPIGWDDSVKPWRMTVADPNFPATTRTLTVNPDNNTFEYIGGSTYRGGEWSGGRMHFMPFSLLCSRPRTPVWDAILLLLAGTVIILADDAQTVSITDGDGNDLNAYGSRALTELKAGRPLNDFFVSYRGSARTVVSDRVMEPITIHRGSSRLDRLSVPKPKGSIAGEILLRMAPAARGWRPGGAAVDPGILSHVAIAALPRTRAMTAVRRSLDRRSDVERRLADRTLDAVVNDAGAMRALEPEVRDLLRAAARETRPGDFRHKAVGLRGGEFRYAMKHGLMEVKISSAVKKGEATQVDATDIGSSTNTIKVKPDATKPIALEISHKLGVAGDHVRIRVDKIPAEAGKEVQFSLKPGLGGLEIVTGTGTTNAPVSIDGVIGGKKVSKKFSVPLEGGARIKLSTILSKGSLGVSRIDKLFGPAKEVHLIDGD